MYVPYTHKLMQVGGSQFLLDSRLCVNKHCVRCVILDNAYVDLLGLQKLAPTQEG